MKTYDKEVLREMASRINLVEYAGRTMNLRKTGSKWFTNCPLHSDSTPSLCINPESNTFYCFSCRRHGNIYNWLMVYENMSFSKAVEKVSAMTGMAVREFKQCESLAFLERMKRLNKTDDTSVTREILPESFMDRFSDEVPQLWVDEGISPEVMKEYGIRIDHTSNRIVYPIRDADFNLIGCKGRTMYEAYKKLGIAKYQYYTKIGTSDFFVGMKENRDEILKTGQAIIFEGIKSGMHLTSMTGQHNWLAAETSCLNESQIKILIKLRLKEIVIAFDQDVAFSKIKKNIKEIRRFSKVAVVYDRNHLLDTKMSPVDKGLDVWKKLYDERVFVK